MILDYLNGYSGCSSTLKTKQTFIHTVNLVVCQPFGVQHVEYSSLRTPIERIQPSHIVLIQRKIKNIDVLTQPLRMGALGNGCNSPLHDVPQQNLRHSLLVFLRDILGDLAREHIWNLHPKLRRSLGCFKGVDFTFCPVFR